MPNFRRYMTAGKHIGKVLIKIRPEENSLTAVPVILLKEAVPRYTCCSEKVYIICGGLGGMGLELADWLVLRGAKKLILTSRSGITTGYQKMRINLWKSYGTITLISTADLSKPSEIENLLKGAENFGPVSAIFNLAAITEDKFFDDQDPITFESVAIAKIKATSLLDRISRELCPSLQHFVVFSSVACGFGNAAQTNYGYANSVCERICEQRRKLGLPGLAIQWGVVGDVGMTAKLSNAEKSFGLKEQPIRSCLSVMDKFLNQPEAVVTSYIMGDKDTNNTKNDSLVESIANILGIQDLKTISMYSPLPELGMDSISGLEIKQTLEQQYDIFLSPKEIISLTFAQLEEIQKTGKQGITNIENDNNIVASIPYVRNILLTKPHEINLSTIEAVVRLPSLLEESDNTSSNNTVFFFPSTDGISEAMKPLARNLNMKTICFQYFGVNQTDSLEDQAQFFASYIKRMIPPTEEFNIVAYSYGVIMALEAIKILNSEKRPGKAVLIDGSIEFAKSLKSIYFGNITDINETQTKVIMDIVATFQPAIANNELQKELNQKKNWESKLDYTEALFSDDLPYKKNLRIMTNFLYHRYRSLNDYHFHLDNTLDTKVAVIRAKKVVFPLPNDMGLTKYFTNPPEEYFVDESHFTILDNKKTAEIVEYVLKEKFNCN